MKKIVLMLAIAMLGVTSAQAQVNLGVKGGFNITDMSLDNDVFETSNRTGFFVGPVLKIGLPVGGLAVDVAALYDQRDAKVTMVNDETTTQTITQKSIVVPANLRLSFGVGGTAGIFVAAGPQIGFNVGDDEYTFKDLKGSSDNAKRNFQLKKSQFSVNLGAGVNFGRIEVGATYNIAISNTADVDRVSDVLSDVYDNRKAKTNAWQIYAALFF